MSPSQTSNFDFDFYVYVVCHDELNHDDPYIYIYIYIYIYRKVKPGHLVQSHRTGWSVTHELHNISP
jgi:hypothetical protein